jgi:hypothetical protein
MPAPVDSNSPAFWWDRQFHLLNSTGEGPRKSDGRDQFHLDAPQLGSMNRLDPWPTWMEAVWPDPDTGVIFGWYHREHFGVCKGSNLSVPQIGAAVSYDGGHAWIDMGAVIASGDPIDCASQNGYFAGGTGDVSVVLDRDKNYFYFFFGVYGGPLEGQGLGIARMPFASRYSQNGAVMKFHDGAWTEPGLRGRITPIFPAKVAWQQPNTDAFWGPAIHWNTYLEQYVMLLNHACCSTGFPQEGIYVSFSKNPGDPAAWSKPKKILQDTGWYPQAIGLERNSTDRSAGRIARLYIYGHSRWEIVFRRPDEPPDEQPQMPTGWIPQPVVLSAPPSVR